ncbi:MAG TPA: hypothetical protein VFV86_12915 [Nitrososphaeraceae archaeon]|nr:hypothetical protein [Nitrososphaeraceae archaeon]
MINFKKILAAILSILGISFVVMHFFMDGFWVWGLVLIASLFLAKYADKEELPN